MNAPLPDPSIEERKAEAMLELAELKAEGDKARTEVTEARADLVQLNLDVTAAEDRLDQIDAVHLLEANQNLVLSTLKAQADADTYAEALKKASSTVSLDVLTGLPNRQLLHDRFTHAIAGTKRNGGHLALLFLDMNNFKTINDTFGHGVGDQALQQAARCIASGVREADTVCRYGGDEFLILLTDISHPSEATLVAQKVASALETPYHIGDNVLHLAATIGICLYPDDGDTPELLIDRADATMYRAKRLGLSSAVFNSEHADEDAAQDATALAMPRHSNNDHGMASTNHERRIGHLREANEQLVLAALSAQDLLAAAQQAQQRQKEFLALVAHELRNPLAPLGVAVSLLRESDTQGLERMRHIIEQQVTHMTRLVGDLLDLSRSNTGKLRLYFRSLDLVTLIDDVVEAWRPSINARLQHLRVQRPMRPISMVGDPIRLAQIMNNLLDNASKYTPDGGEISLTVSTQGENVEIRVGENGIGISADALGHVFDPFAQDTHATAFNGHGLGIGLTVVKELVEGHGGTVTVNSEGLGLGSEFVLTLPLNGIREPTETD